MSRPTTLQINVSAYIRQLRNPEKKRYATDYAAAWLTGPAFPNAEDYDLSALDRLVAQRQIAEIFDRYSKRSGGDS